MHLPEQKDLQGILLRSIVVIGASDRAHHMLRMRADTGWQSDLYFAIGAHVIRVPLRAMFMSITGLAKLYLGHLPHHRLDLIDGDSRRFCHLDSIPRR